MRRIFGVCGNLDLTTYIPTHNDNDNDNRPGLVHWCYCLPLIGPWTVALDCNIKTITMLNVKARII